MIYIDTSLVISFVDEKDPNHSKAVGLMEMIGSEERAASLLVLAELSSVYSRAGLNRPLELAVYSVESVKVRVFDLDFNQVMKLAFRTAPELKLRTLDLLHISACHSIGADRFATFDMGIISRSDILKERFGIEVGAPDQT